MLETDASEPIATQPKAEQPTDANGTAESIQEQIAKLGAEIASMDGKPEFAKSASARRGRITRLRKQLPTSASHAA